MSEYQLDMQTSRELHDLHQEIQSLQLRFNAMLRVAIRLLDVPDGYVLQPDGRFVDPTGHVDEE